MANIYGVPEEVGGYLPQEDTRAKCPFCKGHHTQFIEFEFTNIDDLTHEKHFCWVCEVDFAVTYHPVPYLKEHLFRPKEHLCNSH